MIPVHRPLLPSADEIRPYLIQMDANRYYTNHGPLVIEFEKRLAAACHLSTDQIVTSSNCTNIMAQALRARLPNPVPERAICIVPSWTFVATPAAVVLAQLEPYFSDVSETTWALDPDYVETLAEFLQKRGKNVVAVLVVAPFGAPPNLTAWEVFESRTGIKVVVDAAASFDAISTSRQPTKDQYLSHIPVAVSMHATKSFGIGEGAFVYSSDQDLLKRTRGYGNFGFQGDRRADFPGWNAKLSEIHAAVGLALLDSWTRVQYQWQALKISFNQCAEDLSPIATIPPFMDTQWISPYGLIQISDPNVNLSILMQMMFDRGVETRQWWGQGSHLAPAYRHFGQDQLPNTEHLGMTVFGLPFWLDISTESMSSAFRIFQEALASLTSNR